MTGGLFLVAASTAGLLWLTVVACRNLDAQERAQRQQTQRLIAELRRHDRTD